VLKTADFSKMVDCTESLISLSDLDRWFASDFDRWLASVQTAVVHHSPTDCSQHPKTADQPSLMFIEAKIKAISRVKEMTNPA
jgi:hypothetical protein